MFLGAALTGLTLTVAPASAQPATNLGKATPMTMQHDLAARAKAIHWPEGFNPETADLFSHNSLIHASCEGRSHIATRRFRSLEPTRAR
jgi:hypothetical protein